MPNGRRISTPPATKPLPHLQAHRYPSPMKCAFNRHSRRSTGILQPKAAGPFVGVCDQVPSTCHAGEVVSAKNFFRFVADMCQTSYKTSAVVFQNNPSQTPGRLPHPGEVVPAKTFFRFVADMCQTSYKTTYATARQRHSLPPAAVVGAIVAPSTPRAHSRTRVPAARVDTGYGAA